MASSLSLTSGFTSLNGTQEPLKLPLLHRWQRWQPRISSVPPSNELVKTTSIIFVKHQCCQFSQLHDSHFHFVLEKWRSITDPCWIQESSKAKTLNFIWKVHSCELPQTSVTKIEISFLRNKKKKRLRKTTEWKSDYSYVKDLWNNLRCSTWDLKFLVQKHVKKKNHILIGLLFIKTSLEQAIKIFYNHIFWK